MNRFLSVVLMLWLTGQAHAAPADVEKAGRDFNKQCIRCHQPPDVRFGSDRAWLEQIKETA